MASTEYRKRLQAEGRCLNHPSQLNPCSLCRAWREKRDAEFKAKGLCNCGRPKKESRANCEPCLRKHAANSARDQLRRKAEGKCMTGGCKEPPAPGHTLCETHMQRLRAYAKRRREARKAARLCVDCGKPSELAQARCLTCSEEFRVGLPQPIHTALSRLRKEEELQREDANARRRREFIERHIHLIAKERTRSILRMRYGYTAPESATLEDVGKRLGLTRERVRQIQQLAEVRICMYTIEKDIPIPTVGSGVAAELKETLKAMEAGDSFAMPETAFAHVRVNQIAKAMGMLVVTRRVSDTERRVWVVSKNGHVNS